MGLLAGSCHAVTAYVVREQADLLNDPTSKGTTGDGGGGKTTKQKKKKKKGKQAERGSNDGMLEAPARMDAAERESSARAQKYQPATLGRTRMRQNQPPVASVSSWCSLGVLLVSSWRPLGVLSGHPFAYSFTERGFPGGSLQFDGLVQVWLEVTKNTLHLCLMIASPVYPPCEGLSTLRLMCGLCARWWRLRE